MGCGIFGAGIQGYIVHNASDTGYLGQKCTGYGTLRAPYQWGASFVLFPCGYSFHLGGVGNLFMIEFITAF